MLRAIFCGSIVKSLPQLSYLSIEDCGELVDIIEQSDGDHLHQLCFPELKKIDIKCCHSLKFLFSISTCEMFPKLKVLRIEEASELEQIFICKQDNMEKMEKMGEVFRKPSKVTLRKLPKLISICEGIDFKDLQCEVEDCPKYQETNQIQEEPKNGDSENQATASVLPKLVERPEEAMKTSVEEVSSSMITHSIKEITESSLQENYSTEDAMIAILSTNSNSRKQSTRPFVNSRNDSAQEVEYEQSTREATLLGQQQDLEETKKSMEVSHKTKIPLNDDSINVIAKERAQERPTYKDVILETLFADLALRNLSAASITTSQEEFPLDLAKKKSSGTIMTNQQGLTEKTSLQGVGNIQEDIANMKVKTDASFIYSQVQDSQSGPSTMGFESIQEKTTTMEAKIDTSSFYSHGEASQSGPSMMVASVEESVKPDFQKHDSSNEDKVAIQSTNLELMKQPRGSSDVPLGTEFTQTTKETRYANVQDGPKSEKAEMGNFLTYCCDFKPNIPMEDNTSCHDVIPSSHHQSQTGAAASSSPILEIGEIFQLVELKGGEPVLLAKALELYPQLRLSRGQRTHPLIAFSYRVLVDILVLLATKTPCTITASDRTALEANLGAATFLGFDKDWIKLVQAKVFGIDKSDVLVAEEKISVMEEELEKCDIALERVQKKRIEAKEKLAIAQTEFEAVDTQLFDLLEDRRNLVMKMAEFRKITSAKDRPFGI